MEILENLFLNIFQTSINASIVIVCIIAITKIFNSKINIRIKYILWILAVIRLLIPVVPGMNINTIDIMSKSNDVINIMSNSDDVKAENQKSENTNNTVNIDEKIINNMNNSLSKVDNNNFQVQDYSSNKNTIKSKYKITENIAILKKGTAFIWGIGFFAFASAFMFGVNHFRKRIIILDEEKYKDILKLTGELVNELNIHKKVPIYVSNDIKSPCISGVINPKIYIPEYILEIRDINKLKHIFLHELMHLKRKDLYYNLFSIVAVSIHWFNPLAWIAIKKMRNYREYVCDASVLEFIGEDNNIDYGTTLIDCSRKCLERNKINSFQLAICFEEKNQIKGRISMISKFKNGSIKMTKRGALSCLVASAIILSTGVVIFNKSEVASSAVSSNGQDVNQKSKIIIDSKQKSYSDIKRALTTAGFGFKVPKYIIDGNNVAEINVNNISSDSKGVNIRYINESENKFSSKFNLYIFEGETIEDTLKSIKNLTQGNVQVSTKELSLGNIKGKEITFIDTNADGDVTTIKDFVWEDNNVWYAMEYSNVTIPSTGEQQYIDVDISTTEVQKVAESLVEINSLDKGQYEFESGAINIYTEEDLKYATEKLGFEPRIFSDTDEELAIKQASVSELSNEDDTLTGEYILRADYTYNTKDASLYVEKVNDKSSDLKAYTESLVKLQGGANYERVDGSNVEAYMYEIGIEGKNGKMLNYVWNKDGANYRIVIYNEKIDNLDYSLALKIINSK